MLVPLVLLVAVVALPSLRLLTSHNHLLTIYHFTTEVDLVLLAVCCVCPRYLGRYYYICLLSQREGHPPYPSTCSRSEERLLLLLDYILFILPIVSTVLYYLQPSFAHIASLSRAVTYLLGSATYPVTCLLFSSPDAHSAVGSLLLSHLRIAQGPDPNQAGRSPSPSRCAAIVPAGSISSAPALLPPIRVSTWP